MDVSKNKGTPKWMVKIMENPIQMDDLGVPLFLETSKSCLFSVGDGVIVGVAGERAGCILNVFPTGTSETYFFLTGKKLFCFVFASGNFGVKFDDMYFDELKVLCKSTPIFEPSVCLLEVDRAVFGGRFVA